MKIAGPRAMHFLIALGVFALVLVSSELARSLAARVTGVKLERAIVAVGFSGSRPARAATIAAGSIAMYLAIFLVVFVAHCHRGYPDGRLVVDRTLREYDARLALEPGDQFITVAGEYVHNANDIRRVLAEKQLGDVIVTLVRDGERREVSVPVTPHPDGPRLGVAFRFAHGRDVGRAASTALGFPFKRATAIVEDLFLGEDLADPGGPVRIVQELQTERSWTDSLLLAALFASYALIVIVLADLVRLALLLRRPLSPRAS